MAIHGEPSGFLEIDRYMLFVGSQLQVWLSFTVGTILQSYFLEPYIDTHHSTTPPLHWFTELLNHRTTDNLPHMITQCPGKVQT